jgi:hypothetical protein
LVASQPPAILYRIWFNVPELIDAYDKEIVGVFLLRFCPHRSTPYRPTQTLDRSNPGDNDFAVPHLLNKCFHKNNSFVGSHCDWQEPTAKFPIFLRSEGSIPRYTSNFCHNQLRKYSCRLLECYQFQASAAPSVSLLEALNLLKEMNASGKRKVPDGAPAVFIKPRWENHVFHEQGIYKHFYEMCALAELRNHLRSGDLWVSGSQQYKDFKNICCQ